MGDVSWKDKLPKGAWGKAHHDGEGIDRIEIQMVPRLSGDEWRVSAQIRFYRNGELVAEDRRTRLDWAVQHLPYLLSTLPERVEGPLFGHDSEVCDQVGCSEPPVSTYLIKQEWCVGGGNCGGKIDSYAPRYRRFCERHLRRGDCDLEDADVNYEVIDGPGPLDRLVDPTDESPSAFGGVVEFGGDDD